jgi:predicted phosphodiesterase
MKSKFLVVGDVHGNTMWATSLCYFAAKNGIDTIYQVGDFGLWDHQREGVAFLNRLNKESVKCGVNWYWVPGNHENYDSLAIHRAQGGGIDDRGFVVLRSNIRSTDKALVWTHEGLTFGAVGGAVSIDRDHRTEGRSWWPQEATTPDDISLFRDMLGDNRVDVLLTHDSPTNLPVWNGFVKDDVASENNRHMMNMAYDEADATVAFHGHYHRHLAYTYNSTAVVGLSCDPSGSAFWGGDGRSFAIVSYDGDYSVDVYEDVHSAPAKNYLI